MVWWIILWWECQKNLKKIKFRIFREKTVKKFFAGKVFFSILIPILPTYGFFMRLRIAFQTCTQIFLIIKRQPCWKHQYAMRCGEPHLNLENQNMISTQKHDCGSIISKSGFFVTFFLRTYRLLLLLRFHSSAATRALASTSKHPYGESREN